MEQSCPRCRSNGTSCPRSGPDLLDAPLSLDPQAAETTLTHCPDDGTKAAGGEPRLLRPLTFAADPPSARVIAPENYLGVAQDSSALTRGWVGRAGNFVIEPLQLASTPLRTFSASPYGAALSAMRPATIEASPPRCEKRKAYVRPRDAPRKQAVTARRRVVGLVPSSRMAHAVRDRGSNLALVG